MPELLAAALPFFPALALPGLLFLVAPLLRAKGRTAAAAILLGIAGLLVGDVLVFDHGHVLELEVPNVFPRDPATGPERWVTETVTAKAWHWHVWVAAMLALPALVLLLRRNRAPSAPPPLVHGALVFWFYVVLRLGLEKTAAHEGLVWACGATPALVLILPFFGWYCGRRGMGLGKWIGGLVLLAWIQRLPLIAFAYFATTRRLGTHLDTHRVTEMDAPIGGHFDFGGDEVRGWIYLTLIPHLTLWVVFTLVVGVVLGVLPWALARRRGERPAQSG